MLLLLLACWSPDPPAAPVVLPALDPVLTGPDGTGAVQPAEPAPPGEVEDTDGDADGDTDATEPDGEELPKFDAYDAATASAPVTIVDDFGKPLTVIGKVGTVLKVVGEEPIRKRVVCDVCAPAAEGWVQTAVVTDRGAPLPAPR